MSVLVSLTHEVSSQLALVQPQAAVHAGGTGIVDWLSVKSTAVQTLGRGFSVTFAILFVIYNAIVSRGTLSRIIVSGIAAGIFIWVVFNVTTLQTHVDQEVNALRGPASHGALVSSDVGV